MKSTRRAFISGVFHVRSEYYANGWVMPQYHFHEPYEIYILLEGQRTFVISGEHYTLSANDAIFFPSGCFHKCYGDSPIKGLCYHFSEKYIDGYFTEKAKKILLQCFFKHVVIHLETDVVQKIIELSNYIEKNAEWNYTYLARLLELLSISAQNQQTLSQAVLSDSSFTQTVSPIIAYINEHYASINSLQDINQHLNITESHLCRVFKKQTGMTVTYYINYLKIQYSCHRLIDSKRTISTIAKECGYDSSSYYIRMFKKYMNCTPTEFRNKDNSTGEPVFKHISNLVVQ